MTKLKEINEAWLNLDVDTSKLINPMKLIESNDEEAHLKIVWLMSRPEYFSFLCKYILNVNILPSQALMLREMWNRRFPMLIASREIGRAHV